MSEAIAYLSFGDYIEGETRAPNRHERVGGRLFAMAGGSERHDLASGLIYETLAPGARRAGCRTFTANRILRTPSDAAYYPDVMVVCGPAWHRQYEKEAAVIVEVLSPSTAGLIGGRRRSPTPRSPASDCSSSSIQTNAESRWPARSKDVLPPGRRTARGR